MRIERATGGSGPLCGLTVLELGGIGPAPFACMLLADMGARVIRIDRPEPNQAAEDKRYPTRILHRGRESLALDLKSPDALDVVRTLVKHADVLVEGFRPGVTERMGLGPDDCLAINQRLIYGRMTGWGQDGPLAHSVGHDINYIALTGALEAIAPPEGGPPVVPLNLIGDFGGGAMYLAFGILCAVYEARASGRGQVVDAAIVDGTHHLMAAVYSTMAAGGWRDGRANMLQGAAPWYSVYATSDGRYVSIGSLEPRFYAALLEKIGLSAEFSASQNDRTVWPRMRVRFAAVFKTRTRDEWDRVFDGAEVCYAPVLAVTEVASHPHMQARGAVVELAGKRHPAPAPRFSRTRGSIGAPPPRIGQHTDAILREYGIGADRLDALRRAGVIACNPHE